MTAAKPAMAATPSMMAAKPAMTSGAMTQNSKMKDCGTKWQQMKASGTTGGQTYAQFSKTCLKK